MFFWSACWVPQLFYWFDCPKFHEMLPTFYSSRSFESTFAHYASESQPEIYNVPCAIPWLLLIHFHFSVRHIPEILYLKLCNQYLKRNWLEEMRYDRIGFWNQSNCLINTSFSPYNGPIDSCYCQTSCKCNVSFGFWIYLVQCISHVSAVVVHVGFFMNCLSFHWMGHMHSKNIFGTTAGTCYITRPIYFFDIKTR